MAILNIDNHIQYGRLVLKLDQHGLIVAETHSADYEEEDIRARFIIWLLGYEDYELFVQQHWTEEVLQREFMAHVRCEPEKFEVFKALIQLGLDDDST